MNRCQERDQHLSNLTLTILSDSTVTTLTLPSLFVCLFLSLFVCCCCFFFCQRRGGGVGWRAQSAWTTAAHRQGRQGRSIHSPSHHITSYHIISHHIISHPLITSHPSYKACIISILQRSTSIHQYIHPPYSSTPSSQRTTGGSWQRALEDTSPPLNVPPTPSPSHPTPHNAQGGRGNEHFKTHRMNAPAFSERGSS